VTSKAGDRILASRDRVLALWEERVRKEIPTAAQEERAIIINTFPGVLRQIAEALSPKHPSPRSTAASGCA